MTNRELLERICLERELDLEVLTRQRIIDEFLEPDIPTVEAFCGYDLNEGDIVYFVISESSGDPCFVLVREDEDIDEEDAENILEWLGEEYGLFFEVKMANGDK